MKEVEGLHEERLPLPPAAGRQAAAFPDLRWAAALVSVWHGAALDVFTPLKEPSPIA